MVFYIDEAGEGGNLFFASGLHPDFPLPLHPFPPKSQIFTDPSRARGCGNLTFTIFRAE
jgi:hypothetical protein